MHDRLDFLYARPGISNETGLRCRASGCDARFVADGMATSFAILLEVAATRDAHELDVHGLVVPKPAPEIKRGPGYAMRAVIDRHTSMETARKSSGCFACKNGLLDGHVHGPRTARPAADVQ